MATTTARRSNVDRIAASGECEGFSEYILGADLWHLQRDIMRSVSTNRRTAVKACHASSKTFTAAHVVLWWIAKYPDGIVITTATSWTQVERLLWGEIHDALISSKVALPDPLKTEINLGPKNYAIGLSTNKGVRFRGFHGGNVLIVLDEASGVLPEIWEEIDGIMAGGNVHVLAIGNPTVPGGAFHRAFTSERDLWHTITIGAFDTPNLEALRRDKRESIDKALARVKRLRGDSLDRNPRDYLIGRRWVQERFTVWGRESPRFDSRVLGEFPKESEYALIPLSHLERAGVRDVKEDPRRIVYAGIDVAGPGEAETVIVVRQGQNIINLAATQRRDPRGWALAFLKPYAARLKGKYGGRINIDEIGIGEGLYQHLRDHRLNVTGYNVGKPASDAETFANLRAELFWGLRERFDNEEIHGLADETTVSQLSTLQYKETPSGKTAIETKEAALKRGVASPDRADAVMLAFAKAVSRKKKIKLTWGR